MDKFDHIKEKREIEQSEGRDAVGKIISTVMGLGEVYDRFTQLVKPLHVKRKEVWLSKLMHDLRRREVDGLISLKALSDNDEFNTIITKATLLAQQNHQKEKLDALRNVIIHAAKQSYCDELDFTVTDFFLSILGRITPLHIHLLKFFQNPKSYTAKNKKEFLTTNEYNSSRLKIFYLIHPDLQEKGVFIKVYWKELFDFDLVRVNSLNESVSLKVSLEGSTTHVGNQFLEMIKCGK